jgi:hypothetical protein
MMAASWRVWDIGLAMIMKVNHLYTELKLSINQTLSPGSKGGNTIRAMKVMTIKGTPGICMPSLYRYPVCIKKTASTKR